MPKDRKQTYSDRQSTAAKKTAQKQPNKNSRTDANKAAAKTVKPAAQPD
jgi:hypothetical protein